jgi:hypothetical protein
LLNSAGSGEGGTVSLYHQGSLENGVNGDLPISLSPSSELSQYNPQGNLYKFDVPRNVYNSWLENGSAIEQIDIHGSIRIMMPEVRVNPPASGQLNQYMVPR